VTKPRAGTAVKKRKCVIRFSLRISVPRLCDKNSTCTAFSVLPSSPLLRLDPPLSPLLASLSNIMAIRQERAANRRTDKMQQSTVTPRPNAVIE